jgi:hypothetical protein
MIHVVDVVGYSMVILKEGSKFIRQESTAPKRHLGTSTLAGIRWSSAKTSSNGKLEFGPKATPLKATEYKGRTQTGTQRDATIWLRWG